MTSNVIDQPAKADEDRLNMKAYADALTEFIANAQSPLTIALQGEWGSGKTSLMNALRQSLAATDENGIPRADVPYLGVWINTWQYALMSDPQEAIRKILMGIIGQIPEEEMPNKPKRKNGLARFCCAFGKALTISAANMAGSAFGAGQVGSEFSKAYDTAKSQPEEPQIDAESPIEKLKRELKGLVADCCKADSAENIKNGEKCGILVFIDDLDRIDPPLAVQILEFLKNIFDIPKCIFVLAIDYGVVVKGLEPKFGPKTTKNEREFRSFFDKIIQLPFSMPVANYSIDGFLMSSLREIGFIDEKEEKDDKLCEAFTYYALQSVGTNPRSLKRLINYLSLIKLIICKTIDKQDDADFAAWKDVLFALVSLQIQYPSVYEALLGDPNFPNWGEAFEQKWHIKEVLAEGEKEKLEKMKEFDEPWEQILFRFCRHDTFLETRALNISRILNRIKARIEASGQDDGVGKTVKWLLRLSAVTNVKSEQTQTAVVENFSKSQYLKSLRDITLGMHWHNGNNGTNLSDGASLIADKTQVRIVSNLYCMMWNADLPGTVENKNYLCVVRFNISHDGRSFQLKAWGEFWGNTPKEKFHIDFKSDEIRQVLADAETTVVGAWAPFGVTARCDHKSDCISWNVTVPFKDHDELVSEEFSKNFRGSLAKVAAAFAMLLPYRVSVNNNK